MPIVQRKHIEISKQTSNSRHISRTRLTLLNYMATHRTPQQKNTTTKTPPSYFTMIMFHHVPIFYLHPWLPWSSLFEDSHGFPWVPMGSHDPFPTVARPEPSARSPSAAPPKVSLVPRRTSRCSNGWQAGSGTGLEHLGLAGKSLGNRRETHGKRRNMVDFAKKD